MVRPTHLFAMTTLCLCLPAFAATNDASPDMDFLEYLGSWPDSDEEWFALHELEKSDAQVEASGEDEMDETTPVSQTPAGKDSEKDVVDE